MYLLCTGCVSVVVRDTICLLYSDSVLISVNQTRRTIVLQKRSYLLRLRKKSTRVLSELRFLFWYIWRYSPATAAGDIEVVDLNRRRQGSDHSLFLARGQPTTHISPFSTESCDCYM